MTGTVKDEVEDETQCFGMGCGRTSDDHSKRTHVAKTFLMVIEESGDQVKPLEFVNAVSGFPPARVSPCLLRVP